MLTTETSNETSNHSIRTLKHLCGINTRWNSIDVIDKTHGEGRSRRNVYEFPNLFKTAFDSNNLYATIRTGKNRKDIRNDLTGEPLEVYNDIRKNVWFRKKEWVVGYCGLNESMRTANSDIKNSWCLRLDHKMLDMLIILTYYMGKKYVAFTPK
jgi:hypothetical protein